MFFRNLLRSFYDFSFYKEVRTQWKGWAMAYTAGSLAILLAIGIASASVMMHKEFFQDRENGRPSRFEEGLRQIAAQWPHTVIRDNTLTSDAPMPHFITLDIEVFDERINEPAITIDTTGGTTYANMTTPVLITANEIIVREKSDGTSDPEIHSLEDIFKDVRQPYVLNADVMNDLVTAGVGFTQKNIWKFYIMMGAVAWLVLTPFLVFVRLLLIIPAAVAGLIVAQFMNRTLDYDSAVRVIAIALIPLTFVEAFALLAFNSGVSIWIKLLVSLGILAVLLKDEPRKVV